MVSSSPPHVEDDPTARRVVATIESTLADPYLPDRAHQLLNQIDHELEVPAVPSPAPITRQRAVVALFEACRAIEAWRAWRCTGDELAVELGRSLVALRRAHVPVVPN